MEGEKQGHLGNLQEMTLPQLNELLSRQEKLLSRQKFLRTLPDGGQKVKDFAAKLHQMISQKQQFSSAHSDSLTLTTDIQHSEEESRIPSSYPVGSVRREAESDLETLAEGSGEVMDDITALNDCIGSLVLSELSAPRMADKLIDCSSDGGNLETRFPNSYEKVMKRDETTESKKVPFKPNSSLKTKDVHHLPDDFKTKFKSPISKPANTSSSTDGQSGQKPANTSSSTDGHSGQSPVSGLPKEKVKMPDGAVPGPAYKFQGAKQITISESISLQRQQQQQLEKVQTMHAAERLAERLNIKTIDYNPTELDMKYRSQPFEGDDSNMCDSDDNSDNDDVLD